MGWSFWKGMPHAAPDDTAERLERLESIALSQGEHVSRLYDRLRAAEDAVVRADAVVQRLQRAISKLSEGATDKAIGVRVARLEMLVHESASDALWSDVAKETAEEDAAIGVGKGQA
jgi:hypothetical protein